MSVNMMLGALEQWTSRGNGGAERAQLEESLLNVNKAAGQGETERTLMCITNEAG